MTTQMSQRCSPAAVKKPGCKFTGKTLEAGQYEAWCCPEGHVHLTFDGMRYQMTEDEAHDLATALLGAYDVRVANFPIRLR